MNQMLFCAVRLEAELERSEQCGTGILFGDHQGNSVSKFIVTNKHVVEKAHTLRFQLTKGETRGAEKFPLVGEIIPCLINNVSERFHGHPDPKVDVGVIPIHDILHEIATQGEETYCPLVSTQMFASPQQLGMIPVAETLFFIGYPEGHHDSVNRLPIVRRGIVSTPVHLDFNGEPYFLMDAAVFPGSSGSPVVLADIDPHFDGETLQAVRRFYFLGILSHIFLKQGQEARPQEQRRQPGKLVLKEMQLIDLGMAWHARTITETLEDYSRNKSVLTIG